MAEGPAVTVARAAEQLGLRLVAADDAGGTPITGAIVSDLLSYVMAQGRPGDAWVTIQTHPNIVAVAALARLSAVVIAGGFEPDEDTVARAEEEGIPLLVTDRTAYGVAGGLWELGVR